MERDIDFEQWESFHFKSELLLKKSLTSSWIQRIQLLLNLRLNSAQCNQYRNLHYLFYSELSVKLGAYNIRNPEGNEQIIKAEKVIVHPSYNSWLLDHDIMLIKLEKAPEFSKRVAPITLGYSCPGVGTYCLVSGWGNTLSDGGEY